MNDQHPPGDPPLTRRQLRAAERARARAAAAETSAPADREPAGAAHPDNAADPDKAADPAVPMPDDGDGQGVPTPDEGEEPTTPAPWAPIPRPGGPTGRPRSRTSGNRATPSSPPAGPPDAAAAAAADPAPEPTSRRSQRRASRRGAAEQKPASRAGRDLKGAIGVGVGLGAVLLLSLFIRDVGFVVLAIVACGLALWELARAVSTRDIEMPLVPLLVGSAGILVSAYTSGLEAMWVAFMLTAGGAFIWRVLEGSGPTALRDATAAIFAAAYIPFMAGFVVLMLTGDGGPWLVLAFIVLVVSNDLGGYIAGVFFGQHPMAPTVSPKKSWEGFAGSIVLTVAVGVGMTVLALDGPWWAGIVMGVAAVIAATVGDLAESLLKRDLGVKDMGTLLPGHGGVLDRIDSMLVAAPVIFVVHLLLVGN